MARSISYHEHPICASALTFTAGISHCWKLLLLLSMLPFLLLLLPLPPPLSCAANRVAPFSP
jgi:hypothetical protein